MAEGLMTTVKVIACLAVAFVVYALLAAKFRSPEDQERIDKRSAIEHCWENQGKKSLDPGTARFVASACERMEDDYTKRYGRKP